MELDPLILLDSIEFWYWWVAAVIFVGIELFAPGVVFLWMGVAAAIVGFIVLIHPTWDWRYQFMTFAVLAMTTAAGWWFYRKTHPAADSDQPALNRRGSQYVGRVFTLAEPIVNGQGKLKVDDTIWKIEGADRAEGTHVRVVGVHGTVLTVEPA